MKLNKDLFLAATLATLVVGSSLNPAKVKADSYSNEDNRKTLSIDKKLRSIHSSEYVDNISSSTKVFSQDDVVEFKIKVTNTGTTKMKNIKVVDELPPFLKLVFFPGTYNSTENKIEWTIDELDAGNSKDFLIRAKIDKAQEVKTLAKETNVAKASVDGINEKDDAIYYIGTKSGVIVPETGSMDVIFQTIGVITAGISGLALRKKIRGF
ncbi:MAG: DUF11 domain-containing protein [Candidatus Shapirobacteria bacterium]|nr:DUF11 domain-containing protein [Candidatus Shapirobacteria bacterium]